MANDPNNQEGFDDMYAADAQAESDAYGKAKDAARKAKKAKKAVEVASKQASKTAVRAVSRGILYLLPYIGAVLLAILVFIMIISIIIFILSGPDMMRGQITKMTDELIAKIVMKVSETFNGSDYAAVTEQHIIDVGRYIDNMGFNLVAYGFVDDTEIGLMDLNDDGIIDKKDRNKDDNQLMKVNSAIIQDYIAAENRTYMPAEISLSSLWNGLKAWVNGKSEEAKFSRGMIELADEIDAVTEIVIDGKTYEYDKIATGENNNGSSGTQIKSLKKDVEINRETKKMIITITEERMINNASKTTETKIVYNLEGWVGRYGKPVEFLLALHLGTMAPRFAQTVATAPEFETEVNMRLFKSVEVCRLKFNYSGTLVDLDEIQKILKDQIEVWWDYYKQVNSANLAWYIQQVRVNPNTPKPHEYTYQDAKKAAEDQIGITEEDIKKAKQYEIDHTVQKYTPYIASVDKHWYKDWKFKDLDTASSDDAYVVTTPKPKQNQVTVGNSRFAEFIYSSGELFQIAEPKPKQSGPNQAFDDLFTNKEWLIVNGMNEKLAIPAVETDLKISESQFGFQKTKINPSGMNVQTAVVMLQKAAQNSDDAKYILRDLKEYLELKGFKFKDSIILTKDGKEVSDETNNKPNNDKTGNTTVHSSSKLNNLLDGKTANIVYNGNDAVIRTSELQEGTKIKSVVAGTIEKVSGNAVQIKVSSPSNIKGNTLIIGGLNMDSGLQPGMEIKQQTPLGTTATGTDMSIKMQDVNKKSVSIKDNF